MMVRIALENPTWGYSRIVGALQNLGVKRSKTTIANILQKEGIKPPPERHQLDWNGFLKSHWEVLCATDFFTTEVWIPRLRAAGPLARPLHHRGGHAQAVESHAEIVRTGRLGDMLNFCQKRAA
jgi:hypothetical protein